MTNFQAVRAKAPHKATNLPAPYAGSTVTRHGAYTVDTDLPQISALIGSSLEVVDPALPPYVDPSPSPFVTHDELVAVLAGAGGLAHVTEDADTSQIVSDWAFIAGDKDQVGAYARIGPLGDFSAGDGTDRAAALAANGGLFVTGHDGADTWATVAEAPDTNPRFNGMTDGSQRWGPGDGPLDYAQWRAPAGDSMVIGELAGKVGVAGQEHGFMVYGDGSGYAEDDAAGTFAGVTADGKLDLRNAAGKGGVFELGKNDGVFAALKGFQINDILPADAGPPDEHGVIFYLKDVGGKDALFIRFNTGAGIQLAVEA